MFKYIFYSVILISSQSFAYEVDDFYCSKYFKENPKITLTKEINDYTRSKIQETVDAVNKWMLTQKNNKKCCTVDCNSKSGSYRKIFDGINKRLGGGTYTHIEDHIEKTYASKLCLPSKEDSICNGVDPAGIGAKGGLVKTIDKITSLFSSNNLRIGESVNMCGQTLGLDKLGHFFDSGHQMIVYHTKGSRNIDFAIKETLRAQEGGDYGVGTTGVYSFADYTANVYGQSFYLDLIGKNALIQCDDSSGVIKYKLNRKKFDWCDYIHEGWNESINCSSYSFKQISRIEENKARKGYKCLNDKKRCSKIKERLSKDFYLNDSAANKLLNCEDPRLTTIELKFLDKYRSDK